VDKHKLRDIFGCWLMVEKSVGAGVADLNSRESYLRAAHNPLGPMPTGTEGNGVKSMSSKRRLWSACGAALLASGLLAASEAQANLLIDLRLPDGSKAANISAGDTLTIDVFAKVSSANALSSAGFQELQGSFLSNPGATNLLGTIAPAGGTSGFPAVTVEGISPFNATGAVPGAATDLDGDGDIDDGHANSDDPTGFAFIRSERPNYEASHPAPPPPPAVNYVGTLVDAGAAVEWKIGTISFTAANSGNVDGATTNINFNYRKGASGSIFQSAALWFESTGSKDGLSSANMAIGTPVVLTLVPGGGNPIWNVNGGGSWATAGNWLSNSVPNSPTGSAQFLGKITAPSIVTLDGNKQVQQLVFDNANKYTIAPGSGGTLTVGNGTTGTITVQSGTHEISAGVALSGAVTKDGPGTLILSGTQTHAAGASLNVSQGGLNLASNAGTSASAGSAAVSTLALTVSGDGAKVTLGSSQDLKDLTISTASAGTQGVDLASPAAAGAFNALRVYSANLAATKSALNAAVANARTNAGDGIFDSTLHSASAIGVAQIADAHGDQHVEVRATKLGDLNLDGNVTISDFLDLASHFGTPGGWQEGDLNYDGSISISDFLDLASNFGTSYSGEIFPVNAEDQKTLASFAASIGASVPEPGTMGVIAVGAFGLLGRRRRRQSRNM